MTTTAEQHIEDREILDKLVCEKIESSSDEFFDFDGKNCDDPCAGWDGISRRCECTNRRVLWVLSDDKTFVYAEAW